MIQFTKQNIEAWGKKESFRTMCTKAVTMVAGDNTKVLYMQADLGRAMNGKEFYELYPDRYIQIGIAEQNLIGVAIGLATSGFTPFLTTFAPFITMRCLEQIRNAAYANLDIKLIGSESGFSLGTLGVTHYGLEDIGVLRSISGLTIMSPADGVELAKMLEASSNTYGPVYLRMGGTKNLPRVYEDDYKFEIGKAVTLNDGNDAAIIATGVMVAKAMEAVKILSKQGINVRLINIHTIKPIDKNVILKAAKETKQIVTIEEHNITGGLGSAVADVLAEAGAGTLTKLGIPDTFSDTIAPYEDLLERYGLTPAKIADVVKTKILK